jgi:MFS family permease
MKPPLFAAGMRDKAAETMRRGQPESCCAADGGPGGAPMLRRGGPLPAIAAMLAAFLASQHHNVMMLLLAFGLSDAAMGFMTAAPALRNVMLGMSVAMVAVVAWQIRDSRRPRPMRVMGAISIAVTLGLLAWSLAHNGL